MPCRPRRPWSTRTTTALSTRLYIGDLGGTIWRFKFCTYWNGASCNTSNWSGGRLFSGTAGAVYSIPSVAKDARGNVWVFWGTGDKVDVTSTTAQNKFYAVKDADAATPRALADLINITSSTYADSDTRKGWYVSLAGSGEKVMADSAVFGGVVYFTSFTPSSGGASTCSSGGTGSLYGIDFVGGTGILPSSARSMSLGSGVPSAPVLSFNPSTNSPDLFVTAEQRHRRGALPTDRDQSPDHGEPGQHPHVAGQKDTVEERRKDPRVYPGHPRDRKAPRNLPPYGGSGFQKAEIRYSPMAKYAAYRKLSISLPFISWMVWM